MNTTQIEDQLKAKVKAEIRDMIDNWVNDIDKLQKKYEAYHNFFYIKERSPFDKDDITTITCTGISEFREKLVETVHETYSERMLKVKTKELLDKLDLI